MGQVINPYAFAVSSRTLGSIISGGTNFGDMTGNGNLAASYDGTTNQAHTSSSTKSSATAAYIGKTPAAAHRIFQVISYGSNSNGYVNGANPNVTLELRGQVGGSAPANLAAAQSAGVSLGNTTFTDTANESGNPRTVTSTDNETLFDHVWTVITQDGAAASMYSAEQQFYESV